MLCYVYAFNTKQPSPLVSETFSLRCRQMQTDIQTSTSTDNECLKLAAGKSVF